MAPLGGLPPAKKFDNPLREGDVFEVVPPLAAGHGDPLLREPDLVAQDVVRGRLATPDADRIYGVVLDVQGRADAGATVERRAQIREQRLADLIRRAERPRGKAPDEAKVLCHATETVSVRDVDGSPLLCCGACREILGALEAGYRDGCGWLETRLETIDPELFLDPLEQLQETLVVRHYTCPGCAALLDADICRPTDPSYIDVLLKAPLV